MGEKEQGTAQSVTAPRDVMTGQSSGRSIPENSPDPGDDDGVGTLDEGPVSVVKTKTKSNQSNDRLGREDDPAAVDDDGDGAVDEDPVSVLKNKTKSNQSNDRLGHEGVAIEGTPKTPIP